MCGFRSCGHVSVLTGYVSANGYKTRHQSEGIVPCGDGRAADEKSPVNQRFLLIWGKNGCVFQFPQNGYEGIDLPRGIGCGERKIYILVKGYVFAKVKKRAALHSL